MRRNSSLVLVFGVIIIAGLIFAGGCARVPNDAQAGAAPNSNDNNAAAATDQGAPADQAGDQATPTDQAQVSSARIRESKPSAVASSSAVVPAGSTVVIRLQQPVSSASARPGQRFEAVLDQSLVVNGHTVAPKGANVVGRVIQARHSGRLHNSGYLRLTLAAIEIRGQEVPLQTSSIALMGGAHKKRNLAMIGGGTGAGALIGGLAGGGKGALIGALVGGAGGTGAAYATGKKDVGFATEQRLTFRLTGPLTVS